VIENRMPTGLAVTPPMQHGVPWPSAGPPFFSAVGMPWTILRFARRICFDGWTESRLPEIVRDAPPTPPAPSAEKSGSVGVVKALRILFGNQRFALFSLADFIVSGPPLVLFASAGSL
jgi:hypothetical protein